MGFSHEAPLTLTLSHQERELFESLWLNTVGTLLASLL